MNKQKKPHSIIKNYYDGEDTQDTSGGGGPARSNSVVHSSAGVGCA